VSYLAFRTVLLSLSLMLAAARNGPTPTVFDLDRTGRLVPDLTLTTVDGSPIDLTSPFGRPVLMFLFASWCEPCMLELPWIKAAYARYGNQVAFIGVDVLESRANAAAFVRTQAFPFDVAIVDKATIDAVADDVVRQNGGEKYLLPAAYAVGADGVIRGAWHGVPVTHNGTPVDPLPNYLDRLGIAVGRQAP
jgi:thiol-disulfide isomerase/thioredoxin